MRKELSDITVIADRSGSMSVCRDEAENGINHFIDDQKKQSGEATFSLVHFDTEYEFAHRAVPIQTVPHYTLVPRGMTALLDAVGRAINETGNRLSEIAEADRPGLVVFVIVTDGQENSSHEFTKAQIKGMIDRQQRDYAWQFTFLGANQDAFAEAHALGIVGATAQVDIHNINLAYKSASNNVTRMRHASTAGMTVSNAYTADELKNMSDTNAK